MMSEWLAVEATIRQHEKETTSYGAAKSSSKSIDSHMIFVRKDSSLSNDVFESVDADERTHPETVVEESHDDASTLVRGRVVTDGKVSSLDAGDEVRRPTDISSTGYSSPAIFKRSLSELN